MPKIPEREKRDHKIEAEISDEVREAIASPDSATWRNNVGQLTDLYGNRVVYGLCVGSADLIRLQRVVLECPCCKTELPPIGRLVAIETKTKTKKETPFQEHFRGLVNSLGGVAGVARSAPDALALVERARRW